MAAMAASPKQKKNDAAAPGNGDRTHADGAGRPSSSDSQPSTSNSATSNTEPSSSPTRGGIIPFRNPFATMSPSGATRVRDPPSPWFYGGSSGVPEAEARAGRQTRLARHLRKKADKKKDNGKTKGREEERDEGAEASGETTLVAPSGGAAAPGADSGPGPGLLSRVAIRARPSFGGLQETARR